MKLFFPTLFTITMAFVTSPLFAAETAWQLKTGPDGVSLIAPTGGEALSYLTRKPAGSTLSANSACCFYPLRTPSGESVVTLGPPDHKHHRGVFFAWYQMLGKEKADFWGWGEYAPTAGRIIRNRSVELGKQSAEQATLNIANDWLVQDAPMLREKLTATTKSLPEGRWLDLTFVFSVVEEIKLPQVAFSGFCVKAQTGKKAVFTSPDGPVNLPAPHYLKPETDWPDAAWYDYSVELPNGKTVGLAILSHASNPPTKWHNIAGIGMMNPCILAPGEVTLKPAAPLTLRYALLVHDGAAPVAALNRLAASWRASGGATPPAKK